MMAVGIVDIFEMVQIDKQQGTRLVVAPRGGQNQIQFFLKAAPVQQAGQGIMIG